jgi:hypothetical protein
MNSTVAHKGEETTENEPFFCLREKSSQRFWNGTEWSVPTDAKTFSALDSAFQVAHRLRAHVDLVVMFPTTSGRLVIPLN